MRELIKGAIIEFLEQRGRRPRPCKNSSMVLYLTVEHGKITECHSLRFCESGITIHTGLQRTSLDYDDPHFFDQLEAWPPANEHDQRWVVQGWHAYGTLGRVTRITKYSPARI